MFLAFEHGAEHCPDILQQGRFKVRLKGVALRVVSPFDPIHDARSDEQGEHHRAHRERQRQVRWEALGLVPDDVQAVVP